MSKKNKKAKPVEGVDFDALRAREKAIKKELKRKAREQLEADATGGSNRDRDLANATLLREQRDAEAAKAEAEKVETSERVGEGVAAGVDPVAIDAKLKDERRARREWAVIDPAAIDRADHDAVTAYNALVRRAGLADFLTSDRERAEMAARLAEDPGITLVSDAVDEYLDDDRDPENADMPNPEPSTGKHVAEEVDTDHGREFAVGTDDAVATFAKPSESGKAEVAFNGNGQYVIMAPDGKKSRGYTRATTYIDGLEYDGALTDWKLRQILEGVALDTLEAEGTGLVAKVHDAMHVRDVAVRKLDKRDRRNELAHGERETLEALIAKAFKATVSPIVAELNVIAGTHRKADKGTAIHALCELHDAEGWLAVKRLRDAGEITDADVDDVRAYATAIEALGAKVLESEVVVVNDVLKTAGRADRVYLVKLPGSARAVRVIGDLKTGKLYSPGKLAQQLALYAGSDKYDPETGARSKLGVSQAKGLIVHLPAGSGRCSIYIADLAIGRRGNALSGQVRAWRNEGKAGVDLATDLTVTP